MKARAWALGAVLAALATIFSFLNGIPWERKGAVAELKSDIHRELSDIKTDVREIRQDVKELVRRGR